MLKKYRKPFYHKTNRESNILASRSSKHYTACLRRFSTNPRTVAYAEICEGGGFGAENTIALS